MSRRARLTLLNCTILSLVSMVSLLPFYIMFMMATHYNEDLYKFITVYPGKYTWHNLQTVLNSDFLRYYWNSLYIAVLATALTLLVCSLAGYTFAKHEFRGKKLLFYSVLAMLMIPSQLGLVAFVLEMRLFGWVNTHYPFVIPVAANAFGVFWMTQYIRGNVPTEVLESARIDGCSEPGLFVRIVIPYIAPALVTLGLMVFMGSWNNYLTPLILINRPRLYTIPLGISSLGNQYRTDYAARIMGLSLGTLPLILMFIFGSKYFIQGLTAGSIKG